jgi:hypothetical protein
MRANIFSKIDKDDDAMASNKLWDHTATSHYSPPQAQEQWVDEMIVQTGVDAVLCKNLHRGLLPVPHASCEL